MIERAIDVYKTLRKIDNENESYHSISISDLENWINRIFEHALLFKDNFLAIGLAIETNRDDILMNAVEIASKGQKITILYKTLEVLTDSSLMNTGRERMLAAFTNLVLQLSENDKHFVLRVYNFFKTIINFLYFRVLSN